MSCVIGNAQESVFSSLRSNIKRADNYFEKGHYQGALDLYTIIASKEKYREQLALKLARTYLKLNDCFNSSIWYSKHLQKDSILTSSEYIDYADMLAGSGQYDLAVKYYRIGSELDTLSLNVEVIDKIWQLSNIQNLYEDSIKYLVRPIEINTPGPEFCVHTLERELSLCVKIDALGACRRWIQGLIPPSLVHITPSLGWTPFMGI